MSDQETQGAPTAPPKESEYQIYHKGLPGTLRIVGKSLMLVAGVNAEWNFTSVALCTHDGRQATNCSVRILYSSSGQQIYRVTGNKEAADLANLALQIVTERSGKTKVCPVKNPKAVRLG
ncbi:hypothetical protein FBEOM_4600 [Fusarium beomiforme]|uniref:Uncharacterized protein n=1 Tax=Fusarium beomiforme TaxID=44412 RepID=A0A9P5AMQ7_9HYPO|nr:hypothetical protein FBEOM_4600 [Fusarium beomiforme]